MKTRLTKNGLTLLFSAAVLVASARMALASGSYTSRPPQPRIEKKSLDRARYSLGQRLFDNKVKLDGQVDASAQRTRLETLQARLPERVAKKKDLPALAGRMSAQQLDALEYYVGERYAK
jgi:hypothetical protein